MKKIALLLSFCILCSLFSFDVTFASENKYIKVEAGDNHIVAIKEDGTVWSWGDNMYGCLGDGTAKEKLVPTQAIGISDVIDIAAGSHFTIALKADGTVWGWGMNYENRLGIEGEETYVPVQIPNLHDIVVINADQLKTYALDKNGKVYINCNEDDCLFPYRKTSPEKGNIKDFKIYASHYNIALGIKNDNTVWKWDIGNDYSQSLEETNPEELKDFKGARDVAVGQDCFFIVCADGRLVSYGKNDLGLLGNGFNSNVIIPHKLEGIQNVKNVSAESVMISMFSFKKSIYVLHNDRTVSILYDGKKEDYLKKIPVDDVIQIMQTDTDAYVLKKDGTVWMWQTESSDKPKQIAELSGIISLFNAGNFEGAIDNNGNVFIKNYKYGSMGFLRTEKNDASKFDLVTGLGDINRSIPFLDFAILINKESNEANVALYGCPFTKIPLNESNIFVKLAMNALADGKSLLDYDRTVCMFHMRYKDVSGEYTSIIFPINGLENTKDIENGNHNILSLKEDGTVWLTSIINEGCLIDDYSKCVGTPVKIEGLKNINKVAGGGGYYFAIDQDANLYAWGKNGDGELYSSEFYQNRETWQEVVNQVITLNLNQSKIYINGYERDIPSAPIKIGDTTMIPIREVIEGLGGNVEWDEDEQMITVSLSDKKLTLCIGDTNGKLNGEVKHMKAAPQLIDGKTFLPLRYVCECVGAKVLWEDIMQKITIIY